MNFAPPFIGMSMVAAALVLTGCSPSDPHPHIPPIPPVPTHSTPAKSPTNEAPPLGSFATEARSEMDQAKALESHVSQAAAAQKAAIEKQMTSEEADSPSAAPSSQ